MAIILEDTQRDAVEKIDGWYKAANENKFVMSGLAGTGKTTIVKYFMNQLNIHPADVAFVAFTGKAALVLTSMGTPATTIHKLIYKPVEDKDGNITFSLVEKLPYNLKLIVVDEASMVNADVQEHIESFNVPVIYIGDHGQLPPVDGVNKLMMNPNIKLEKIHRQAEGNPIIWLAKMARLGAKIPFKHYNESIVKMHLNEVTPTMLTSVDQILCGKNVTRHKLNDKVRMILGRKSPKVAVGDKVTLLRNNWQQGYINGLVGEVQKLYPFDMKDVDSNNSWRYHVDQQAMDILCDYNEEVIYNVPYDEGVFTRVVPPDMKNRCIEPIDYAYAMTVHKSQGSQYQTGLVIEERLGDNEFHKKWLYTAITRFVNGLIIAAK